MKDFELSDFDTAEIIRVAKEVTDYASKATPEPWVGCLGLATAVASFLAFNFPGDDEKRNYYLNCIHEWMRNVADGTSKASTQ